MALVENLMGLNNDLIRNQFVINTKNYIYFQSYESIIARVSRATGKLEVSCNWCYSKTTTKYFYQFVRLYVPNVTIDNCKEMRKLLKSGEVVETLEPDMDVWSHA